MGNRRLTVEFEPTFENVDIMRSAISGICQNIFPAQESESLTMDFALAVTEAMNNALEHSGTKNVVIELTVTANAIIFKMMTDGVKFDPTADVSFPDMSSPDDMPEGGFGRAIMKEMTDRMTYEYRNRKNILTLEKTFSYSGKGAGNGI